MQIVNPWRFWASTTAFFAALQRGGAVFPPVVASSLLGIALLLATIGAAEASESAGKSDCETLEDRGESYVVCSFDPSRQALRIYSHAPDGAPFGGFDRLVTQLWKERRVLRFATNGGMYHQDMTPVGLFMEHGIERQPVSTRSGYGNFHLKPNGVFYVDGKTAGVRETAAFRASGLKPDFATQSGPMLVINGRLHPKFLADSDSFKRRNGVGVDADGRVHFVISKGVVRFHDFALLFRDRLGCRNALYLDGTISSLYAPELGRNDRIFPLGPIIAVSDLIAR